MALVCDYCEAEEQKDDQARALASGWAWYRYRGPYGDAIAGLCPNCIRSPEGRATATVDAAGRGARLDWLEIRAARIRANKDIQAGYLAGPTPGEGMKNEQ